MDTVTKEIETLKSLPVAKLHERFQELFGAKPTSRNRDYLAGKIARHAGTAAPPAPQKVHAPKKAATKAAKPKASTPGKRDPRLPAAGTTIARTRKGKEHRVKVLSDGFEYQGKRFTSLSAIAQKITGHPANGFAFFQLGKKRAEAPQQ